MNKDAVDRLITEAVDANNQARAAGLSLDPTTMVAQGVASLSSAVLALLILERGREDDRAALRDRQAPMLDKLEAYADRVLNPPAGGYATDTNTYLPAPVYDLVAAVASAVPTLQNVIRTPGSAQGTARGLDVADVHSLERIVEAYERCEPFQPGNEPS